VQCVVVTLARLGIELAPSVQKMLGRHEMMPDVGAWTEASLLHELAEFAPPPLFRRYVSTSSQRLVLKCGLNNWKRISSELDMQKIGKATELKRKRREPSSDEEEDSSSYSLFSRLRRATPAVPENASAHDFANKP
jgi:hypothetical protein